MLALKNWMLEEIIRTAQKFKGFRVDELSPGTLIELRTLKSTYIMLVVEPESGQIIFFGGSLPALQEPRMVRFHGSVMEGSYTLFCDQIKNGLSLQISLPSGDPNFITTSPLTDFTFLRDAARAETLLALVARKEAATAYSA